MTSPKMDLFFVRNRSPKAGERESPDQWLDRVLEIQPGEERGFFVNSKEVVIQDNWGRIISKNLSSTRRDVLLGEYQRRSGMLAPNGWEKDDGAIVILRNGSHFFLSYKDALHPNERCRGRLCFVGGALEENEPPQIGILRELYEEIREPKTVDLIASHMVNLGTLKLPSIQWDGSYRCHVFLSTLDDVAARDWVHQRTLLEGFPIKLSCEEMKKFIQQEELSSGSKFVASHHRVARLALNFETIEHGVSRWPNFD